MAVSFLIVFFATINAEPCSDNWSYQIVSSDRSSLRSEEVISSHQVKNDAQVNCNYLCYKVPTCVGFNFRSEAVKTNDGYRVNCQLTNTTQNKNNEDGDWTLFHKINESGNRKSLAEGENCADIQKSGVRQGGLHTIDPDGLGPFQVRCDMETDGGGWTVFQRRHDANTNFYREWYEYKVGFGNLADNFWIGLDKLHRLTKSGENVLRVDLVDFDLTSAYANYNTFKVASERDDYKLSLGSYSGNAGNSFASQHGYKFTTSDRDNDVWSSNCAVGRKGGWWYSACTYSNLNGLYLEKDKLSGTGINWYYWKNDWRSMKFVEMKIRPSQF